MLPLALAAQSARGPVVRATSGPASDRPAERAEAASDDRAGPSAIASIAIEGGAKRLLVGATVPHVARVRDAAGAERRDVPTRWTSSNPNIASINQFGVLSAVRPGAVTVRVQSGGLSAERRYTVEPNPVRSLTLSITADQVQTGDVVEVVATAFDANGLKVPNVPFLYTFTAAVEDTAVGQLAPAELDQKGRFVAQKAGDYQIIAVGPGLVAHRTIRVSNRTVAQQARVVGRIALSDAFTSDLSAWRGADGRDYLLTCTTGARARVITHDMSDVSAPRALDTVTVDARAVGECVVDPDSRVAAVVRERAGESRGGISFIDVSNPRDLKLLSTFEDAIGSVRGVVVSGKHVFAVSDAQRLDVISIEDRSRPRRTATLQLRSAGDGASDVSVADGIAYVALGRGGLALVDVGNGKFGGSPGKPVRIGGFHAPFASTHAAYPYRSRTGKWYVIASEDLPAAPSVADGTARHASLESGFARIIDFTDPSRPEEVARYEVPEAGVEDLWVDGERLYVAAQNGGLRVVDLSADLKGNLYHQGREVARFHPVDAKSMVPNTTAVVAVQPHHGTIFVADRNSGVWAVKVGGRD